MLRTSILEVGREVARDVIASQGTSGIVGFNSIAIGGATVPRNGATRAARTKFKGGGHSVYSQGTSGDY